jgi:hypothetical protein
MTFVYKDIKWSPPNEDESWLCAISSTSLDGEYCGNTKYYKVLGVTRFSKASKHYDKVKMVYFKEKYMDTINDIILKRSSIPNSDILTAFKTPGLKMPRDFDPWASCTQCRLIAEPEDKRNVQEYGLAGMPRGLSIS